MILLLSGKQGSGKTSIQKQLAAECRKRFKCVYQWNFADPLYVFHDYILIILAQIDKGSWLEKRKVILPTKGE